MFTTIDEILDGVKAVIFDLDGTLYDKRRLGFRLIMARPQDVFLVKAERTVRKGMKGVDFYSSEAYYDAFFREMNRHTRKTEAYLRKWYFCTYMPGLYAVMEKHYTARQGTQELFNGLTDAGIPYAVYSDYPETQERLDAIGLNAACCGGSGRFYGPDSFGALKPARRPFVSIALDLGCTPEKTLVVGDRDDTDGAGARSCGMRFALIQTRNKSTSAGIPWELFSEKLCEYAGKILLHRQANNTRPNLIQSAP